MRLANALGTPVEWLVRKLPGPAHRLATHAVQSALERALGVAIKTLPGTAPPQPSDLAAADSAARGAGRRHRWLATATGAAGGAFGWPGLAVELPLTTSVLLRSIASVARELGEDLADPVVRLECMAVLAHGSPAPGDDAVDSSYLAARATLANLVQRAAQVTAGRSASEIQRLLGKGGAPVIARLLAAIAARFDVVVSEKVLAQAVPVVGAAGGALVNAVFAEHFNSVARFHFGLRRLERIHGEDAVREAYRSELARAGKLRNPKLPPRAE